MIRVGIIGCGAITLLRHGPECKANPDIEVAGFYDLTYARAEHAAGLFGGRAYTEYTDLIQDESIDAVCVCTANSTHAQISIAALNAGKHVLCEKPIATNADDAQAMIEAARTNGRWLMIGHSQRLDAAHMKVKSILESGELGRVLGFRTTFGHSGPETWSVNKGKNTWFFNKSLSFAGAIGDLGIHKVDLIRWLINEEIVEVKAFAETLDKRNGQGELIDVDDHTVAVLKTASGVTGTMTASWLFYGEEDNSTVLYCAEGIVKMHHSPDHQIEMIKRNGERLYYKIGQIQTNNQQTSSGVVDAFANSIINNESPPITGEDGLAALQIIIACLESSKTGQEIRL